MGPDSRLKFNRHGGLTEHGGPDETPSATAPPINECLCICMMLLCETPGAFCISKYCDATATDLAELTGRRVLSLVVDQFVQPHPESWNIDARGLKMPTPSPS